MIIPGVQRLNEAARAKGIPIVYTTTAYAVTEGPNTDMGLWHHKIPVEVLKLGTDAVAIDERIAPEPGEHVIVKKHASAFLGTHLANLLRAAGVDTVIITGVTMAGCVRHTTEDAIGYGFRPIVVRECVGDRVAGRRRVEPVRHRREVRRRRAARDGARLPRRRRTAGRSSGGYRFSLIRVQRPMRVRRRMPSRRCSARSSSPSFLAAQTNIAKTTPALSRATTESKTPSATVTGRIVPVRHCRERAGRGSNQTRSTRVTRRGQPAGA